MKKIFLLLSVLFLFSCTKETIKFTLTTSVNPIDAGTVNPETRQYNEGDTANLIASPAVWNVRHCFSKCKYCLHIHRKISYKKEKW